jgi:hypothetical protein
MKFKNPIRIATDLDSGRCLFVSELTGSRGVLKEITVK